MVYWDGFTYRASSPTIGPSIRNHVALWRRFRKASGRWPTLSIIAFVVRFVIAITAIIISLWFHNRHNLRRGEGYLVCLALVCTAVAIWWFFIELRLWNYYLRREGISSKRDLWDTDQFPSK
jgi:membrane protein YdbS with pleckstrin-like domain